MVPWSSALCLNLPVAVLVCTIRGSVGVCSHWGGRSSPPWAGFYFKLLEGGARDASCIWSSFVTNVSPRYKEEHVVVATGPGGLCRAISCIRVVCPPSLPVVWQCNKPCSVPHAESKHHVLGGSTELFGICLAVLSCSRHIGRYHPLLPVLVDV